MNYVTIISLPGGHWPNATTLHWDSQRGMAYSVYQVYINWVANDNDVLILYFYFYSCVCCTPINTLYLVTALLVGIFAGNGIRVL